MSYLKIRNYNHYEIINEGEILNRKILFLASLFIILLAANYTYLYQLSYMESQDNIHSNNIGDTVHIRTSDGLYSRFVQIKSDISTVNNWFKILGGNNYDYGHGIEFDSSGNIYITGETLSYGAGYYDAFITKLTPSGTLSWFKTFGGDDNDNSYDIAVDSAGNIYVTGETGSYGAGFRSIFISKFTSSGILSWFNTISGDLTDCGYGIAVDSSGYVYITGETSSYGAGDYDVFVAKLDSTGGDLLWFKTIGGSNIDRGYGIAIDSSGYVYITGETFSYGAGDRDAFIAKLDASGNLLWFKIIGGENHDSSYGIAIDASGYIYITGYTDSYGAGETDILIAKVDALGNLLWLKIIGGNAWDYGHSIVIDASNNIYITGDTNSYGAGNRDVFIARLDSSGSLLWFKTIGSCFGEFGTGSKLDSFCNIYLTGCTYSYGAGYGDVLVVKLNISHISNLYYSYFPWLNLPWSPIEVHNNSPKIYSVNLINSASPSINMYSLAEVKNNPSIFLYSTENHLAFLDADMDEMPDYWESMYGLNPLMNDSLLDVDDDGLSNLGEYQHGTDPTDSDSDNDGMPDGWEVRYGLDPLLNGSSGDADSDGLSNLSEYQHGTDPTDSDSDNDGLPDGWEVQYGLDLLNMSDSSADLDGDGLDNVSEFRRGTDPCNADSDGDGFPDGLDLVQGISDYIAYVGVVTAVPIGILAYTWYQKHKKVEI